MARVLSLVSLATLAIVAAGCRRGARGPEPVRFVAVNDTDRLYADDGEAITDSTRQIVMDSSAYALLWARATRAQRSEPPRPLVDFTRQWVVLVSAGRMRPGDRVQIDSLGPQRDDLVLIVRTTVGCAAVQGAAYPLDIVRVPRVKRQVRFVERRERADGC
jgi:hypothetical protein